MSSLADHLYLGACGMINALGDSCATIAKNLFAGSHAGIVPWDIQVNDKTVYVGQVNYPLPIIPDVYAKYACRNNSLMLAALLQIQDELDNLLVKYQSHRIAIVLGTSTSGILEGENALQEKMHTGHYPEGFHYRQQEIGTPAIFLRDYLGLNGLAYTISTACSSSAKVFASARRLIESGLCDAAIIGGVDSLCRLTVFGFSALESVSKGRCNPMSVNRDGINIGEAAALFILSRDEAGIELLGTGESSDAYHMSAPHPEGKGAFNAMDAALRNAGLAPDDIAYVNLHGTATHLNDAMESIAVNRLFGANTPCSSTKSMTGHTLGAAGATEAGFCWLMLSPDFNPDGYLPPHIWDEQRDEQLPGLNLVTTGQTLLLPSGSCVLSNSFAFGGNNASVILRKH